MQMENMNKQITKNSHNEEEEEIIVQEDEVQELKKSLEKTTFLGGNVQLLKYQGFWYPQDFFTNFLTYQRHFQAQDSDIIITSYPKTGNTWLKALLFAIVNRKQVVLNSSAKNYQNNPLLIKHPHELVYCLENDIYGKAFEYPQPCHLNELPSPRLFHTHTPFSSLPPSIITSRCRILYLTRNYLDACISQLHFATNWMKKLREKEDQFQIKLPSMGDYFEECYQGRTPWGPFYEHVVEYWNQSLEQPNKVLFLMYEDLKDDTTFQLKRLANFIGLPFSPQEESEGVIRDIIELCSFKNMKELEVNKSGVINKFFEKKSYFRKGEVGDWRHYFTPSMVEKMNDLMHKKLDGTGLSFKLLST